MIWQNDVKPLKGETLKKKRKEKKNTRDAASVGNARRGEPSERSSQYASDLFSASGIKCWADFFTLHSSKVQERNAFKVRPYGRKKREKLTVLGYFIYIFLNSRADGVLENFRRESGFSVRSRTSFPTWTSTWILNIYGSSHKNPNRVHRYSWPSV